MLVAGGPGETWPLPVVAMSLLKSARTRPDPLRCVPPRSDRRRVPFERRACAYQQAEAQSPSQHASSVSNGELAEVNLAQHPPFLPQVVHATLLERGEKRPNMLNLGQRRCSRLPSEEKMHAVITLIPRQITERDSCPCLPAARGAAPSLKVAAHLAKLKST